MRPLRYFSRFLRLVRFIPFYLKEIVLANLRIAQDIITPQNRIKPGIIAFEMKHKSDRQLLAFTNLVTMTPGTLSLDVSDDRRMLFVHALYIDDLDDLKQQLQYLEKRVEEVFS